MLEPVKVTSLKLTLYQAPSEVCTSQHHTPSEICTLHQVIRGFQGEESTIPGNLFSYLHGNVRNKNSQAEPNKSCLQGLGLNGPLGPLKPSIEYFHNSFTIV